MPHLTYSEERALAAVDAQATVTLLAELLAIPSISGSAAESDIQHVMAKKLDGLGLDVDLWPFDLDVLAGTPVFRAWRPAERGLGTRGHQPRDDVGRPSVVPPGATWARGGRSVPAHGDRAAGARTRGV